MPSILKFLSLKVFLPNGYIFSIPGAHLRGSHRHSANQLPLGRHSQKGLLQTQETCRGAGGQVVSNYKISLFLLLILTGAMKQPLQTGIKGASE